MTTYFDHAARTIEQLTDDELESGVFEQDLVRDVTMAAESDGCPESIRRAIHESVLRYCVVTAPTRAASADYATVDEYRRRMRDMAGELHSVFHVLGNWAYQLPTEHPLSGKFSDNPMRPSLWQYDNGQDYRSLLLKSGFRPDLRGSSNVALAAPVAPVAGGAPVRIFLTVSDSRGADPRQISQALYAAAKDLLDAQDTPTWPMTIPVRPAARPLSPRQQVVYEAILRFFKEHGRVPTLRELGSAVGIKSTNGVSCHLDALAKKGWIQMYPLSSATTFRTYRLWA